MSELLGVLGENDEPDPGSSSSNDDEDEDTKVRVCAAAIRLQGVGRRRGVSVLEGGGVTRTGHVHARHVQGSACVQAPRALPYGRADKGEEHVFWQSIKALDMPDSLPACWKLLPA